MRAFALACVVFAGCSANNPLYNCGNLGSACCLDGACQPGGACVNGMCSACGGNGEACCAGGQCQSGAVCANSVCAVCGAAGQSCCAGNSCASGGCCVNGVCTAAGNPCAIGGTCSNGSCGSCGGLTQLCCTTAGRGTTCTAPSTACSPVAAQCISCGGAGQACCAQRTCLASGFVCGEGELCVQCGGAGQRCCAGGACNGANLACSGGICAQCGGAGQACCTGGVCGKGCCDGERERTVCVAEGGTCSTGGKCATGTCPAPMNSCMMGTFPKFERGCTNSDSCSFGLHQVDCCGSHIAMGFNHAARDAFDAAEAAWTNGCPMCACPQQQTNTDWGQRCDDGSIFVHCDEGICNTSCR